MSTDAELADHFGMTEAGFKSWIADGMEEHRVARLRIHRFLHYAGVYKREDPCYCDCGMIDGDPKRCEHEWDGDWIETEHSGTATCSGCGITAMGHDMRRF